MKLSIKNIGKISESTIELKGITVIAGENDTGKSTFGKALFSFFNSFYKKDEQIKEDKISFIRKILEKEIDSDKNEGKFFRNIDKFVTNIVENQIKFKENKDFLLSEIEKFFTNCGFKNIDINNVLTNIQKTLLVSDDDFFKEILQNHLVSEFDNQINNLFFSDQKAEINLEIKNNNMRVCIENNKVSSFEYKDLKNLNTEVIYIDDPFVLDRLCDKDFIVSIIYQTIDANGHQQHLIRKLNGKNGKVEDIIKKGILKEDKEESNIVATVLREQQMQKILNIIDKNVCSGKLVYGGKVGLMYEFDSEKGSKNSLNLKNISTGLKSFIILKTLLLNGSLEENGTIVLDEPEIHLHPQWQKLLAEIIVIIQKELNLHVLINSHSPYFIWGLEVYSKKHGVQNKCKYYITEKKGNEFFIKDTTDDTGYIHKSLGYVFNELEKEDISFDKEQ